MLLSVRGDVDSSCSALGGALVRMSLLKCRLCTQAIAMHAPPQARFLGPFQSQTGSPSGPKKNKATQLITAQPNVGRLIVPRTAHQSNRALELVASCDRFALPAGHATG